jgi:hypothetical protein
MLTTRSNLGYETSLEISLVSNSPNFQDGLLVSITTLG